MKKEDALKVWQGIPANQPILKKMKPIRYKTTGSRYGACGIRIDGTPEFIEAVLSNLKDLLPGENQSTRLELAWNEVKSTEINGQTKTFDNAECNAQVCYIRLHERGEEGKILHMLTHGNMKGVREHQAKMLEEAFG